MTRKNIQSGSRWEPVVGYARAVRVGPHVYVSGTTATDEAGAIVGADDAYAQTVQALGNILKALAAADAGPEHVVRTRMYVTDIAQWEAVGRAHGAVFGSIRPAATMVEVSRLIDPAMLVEIEADAYVPEAASAQATEAEVTITYLEMLSPPAHSGAPALPEGATVIRAENPPVSFYRYLYDAVGAAWEWTDRKKLADDALAQIVGHPDVHVDVLYVSGAPAGYIELDARKEGEVQIAYFGLVPERIGQGLGPALLDWGVRQAWAMAPRRVWVHTCTLDHPGALPLYRRAGFVPYRQETQRAE